MSFYEVIQGYDWEQERCSIASKTACDVERALAQERIGIEDFKALISPAATPYVRQMASKAQRLTERRYGRTIQMYIPLYVSNYCSNHCVYCGFSCQNKIKRTKLTREEVLEEIAVIKSWGYKHLLLVSGEAERIAGIDYYEDLVRHLRPHFAQLSVEVQPLEEAEYARLVKAGVSYVCVYQETYNQGAYALYHPRGKKSDYRYRLETPERCARAGIRKVGLGALIGLEDWRCDALFTARHLRYMEQNYWRTKYSISLPRLRPNAGDFEPQDPISDLQMVQLICAYRLLDPEVEISLSTRESAAFRDMAMHIGVTSMSAASSTEPGGYAKPREALEQFTINDSRDTETMAEAIRKQGYEVVWKDWDIWL